MAQRRTEAWLTSVIEDCFVTSAIVLADSLRKTKTTRTIGVITSNYVSAENRAALRKVFDIVLYMDEIPGDEKIISLPQDIQAKMFALSLRIFEKCVYISPNSMMLENADILFDNTSSFQSLRNKDDDSIDLSLFTFEPNQSLWKCFSDEVIIRNGKKKPCSVTLETALKLWLKNGSGSPKIGRIPDDIVANFSAANGTLNTDKTHAPIVLFVDVESWSNFPQKLDELGSLSSKRTDISMRDKLIVNAWMEMYHQRTNSPKSIPSFLNSNDNLPEYKTEPIAIIGMSCRYPGANTLEEFWNMLYAGEEGVRETPAFRWTKEHSLRVTQQERKTNAGFLSTTVDEFDARFFGLSPKEAAYMDPQARLLHEVLWESLEDSGIDPLSLYGSHTGIFTGSWMNDYKDIVQGSTEKDFFRLYMGNSIGATVARLSFLLGLTGPSIATESGCSSAIVALDLAIKSLRSGETNLALAGGVNLLLHPFTSNIMNYVIAPNGRCKTFDANADGFGRAEGCGVLVLKRLSDALRDRDNIWAMVRGSAVSQEGLSRSLGTPTVHCEALAMQLALKDANVHPEKVSFVETHGTGTSVGDPMEVAAIAKAYYAPSRQSPLVIGSVKTNVGHTESCSGITGIMKTILAMQHELIPKHLNLESLNPEIFLDTIPAMLPLQPVAWPKVKDEPRIAGVSSFGITGTDGHVILQEAPDYQLPKFTLKLERPTHIFKISGKSNEALDELLKEYENLFSERAAIEDKAGDAPTFGNAAFTANTGRAVFSHCAFIVAENYKEAEKILIEKKYLRGEVKDRENSQICFLFTGQGSQYQGMAKTLYETSPVFRINFDACDRTLREMYNLSIREVLWEQSDPSSKELSRTIYSQTSIFCVEYCLLKLWESWGIQPDFVLGHSLGEFCAAVAARILDFKDALKLVAERSRLIDSLPRGSMLVIKASKPEVEKALKSSKIDLDFAAVNNPEQTVVAGDTDKVQEFLTFLKEQGIKAIILEATHAFHSRHMDPMLENYRNIAKSIDYKQGSHKIQYVSGVEGRIIYDSSELTSDYWVRHTREKVSFMEACAALRNAECQNFVELGPQPVLSSFVMMNNEDVELNCLPSLRRGADDWHTILTSLGKLYLLGYKIDWKGYDEPYLRNKVSLPFHPFQRKSFWVECTGGNVTVIHPLVGHSVNNASSLNIYQNDFNLKSVPYVKDHCIGEHIIFPGAGYAEMCLTAGYCVANGLTETLDQPKRAMQLQNVRFDAPLELREGKSCRMQVIVDLPESSESPSVSSSVTSEQNSPEQQTDNQGFRVKIYHLNNSHEEVGKWVLHASANFIPVASTKEALKSWNPEGIAEIISRNEPETTEAFYKRVDDTGLKFGEGFRMLKRFWAEKKTMYNVAADEIVAEMAIPSDSSKYLLHPTIIDATFQAGILIVIRHRANEDKLKVPVRIGKLTMFSGIELKENQKESIYLHAVPVDGKFKVFVCKSDLTLIALVEDIEMIDTNVKTIESVLEQQCSSIPDAWEEVWKVIPSPFGSLIEAADMAPVFLPMADKVRHLTNITEEDWDLHLRTKRLLYFYILSAFLELGWKPEIGDVIATESFCTQLGIKTEFEKLIRFYFTVFEGEPRVLLEKSKECEESWKVCNLPLPLEQITMEMTSLCSALKTTKLGTIVAIFEHLSQNLSKVLTGEISGLSLLFPTDEDKEQFSASTYYHNHPGRNEMSSLISIIGEDCLQLSHMVNAKLGNSKCLKSLEIGAGTGSLTKDMLKKLKDNWGEQYEYYFTDISQAFLLKAEKKFEEYAPNIKYAIFNIEQSPLSQGIPVNYFDFVTATDVIHATRNLEETLVHLRQTMQPGAMLLFTETVTQARDITFIFGLLEGYWRFQDYQWRAHHSCVEEDTWEMLLNKTGFRAFHSYKVDCGQLAVIGAIASENVQLSSLRWTPSAITVEEEKPGWIIFADESNLESLAQVANMLDVSGNAVTVVLNHTPPTSNGIANLLNNPVKISSVQVVDEQEGSEIEAMLVGSKVQGVIYAWGMNLRETDQRKVALPFLHIAKTLFGLKKPPQLYVLTQGVHAVNEDGITCHPSAATLLGMTKSLKNENWDVSVRYIDLEQDSKSSDIAEQVLFELAMKKGAKEQQRLQVTYRGTVRYEPRLCKSTLQTPGGELKLPPSTDRYHLVLPKSRVIQDLEFDVLDEEEVGDNEVEVKVKAFALNFRDIFAIIKPSAQFENINGVGLDFSGVVTKVGASSKCKVGERVFGANFKDTQLPSHIVLDSGCVLKIPDRVTFWEAATLPAAFATAYHCLINIAKMTAEDTVLIHTGSGGVGLAAVQVAKRVGAKIITTAGNKRKRTYLKSLGIQHVFQSRNTSFEKDILAVTNGKGVNVVLNSITGPGIKEATLNSAAQNARFVEMSKLSIWTPEEVKAMRADVDYKIVDLTVLEQETWTALMESLRVFMDGGHLKAIPYVKFDALNIRQALQYFQKARHIGKIVCSMPNVFKEEGQFKVKVPMFNSESTYLITGGLGGIGFEACKWMIELGATDIVLTGRSPPKPENEESIATLREKGFNVIVRLGDVGDYNQIKVIFDEINEKMKPLRGIMHCAGVLRDSLYLNQTWESFETTFNPKVTGTWNLHSLSAGLPLEHFVLYSSATALVGTPGQSNHAAANSFEDAFIHYRHSIGLVGTTVNWGQWAQVGVAKEVNLSGVSPVSVKRMFNGLEVALKTQKRQVCFSEFDSFANLSILCPVIKNYLDEKLLSTTTQSSQVFKADAFWKEIDAAVTKKEKMDVMSVYLKVILRNALRLEQDEPIKDDANVQELGVDSLMMLELKNNIQSLLGSKLTVSATLLKNCSTVRLISNAIVNKLMEEEDEEDEVSLEPLLYPEFLELLSKDGLLDETIQPESTNSAVKPSQIRTLLVTGATGTLVPYLLAEISKTYTFVEKIVCLVREESNDVVNAEKNIKANVDSFNLTLAVDMSKIECVVGDVTMEHFGLDQDKYSELSKSVDAVIHCAVKRNHSEHYRASNNGKCKDIRSVNVGGTLNILKFACKQKTKHVYYPSTVLCGMMGNDQHAMSDAWHDDSVIEPIAQGKLLGYQTSKFICELLLKQANDRGIPCKVFRFPWVAGDSKTGQLNYFKSLYILRFLSFLKVNAMASLVMPANFIPVDLCTQLSLQLFFSDETPYEVFNVGHPQPQMEQEFVQLAKEEFGRNMEILEWEEFSQLLHDNDTQVDSLKDLYKDQKLMSMHLADAVHYTKGYILSPDTYFKNEKVSKFIPNFEQMIPPSMEILRRDLHYLKSIGFLDKFGI